MSRFLRQFRRTLWRSWPVRVALAVGSVALAQVIEWHFGPDVTGISPLFFVAVVFSAFVGGWMAGLVATALSAVCTAGIYFEMPSPNDGVGVDDAFRLIIFTVVALTVSWLQHINRQATKEADLARREAEQARETAELARRQAVAANDSKDRFLNVLGHELRNPLNPVLAVVTMRLQERDPCDDDGRLREDLEMIRRNVEVEARLIDDLLDSSRIRSGKLRLVRQGVNVLKLLGETVEAVRPAAKAAGTSLSLRLTPAADDAVPIIDGDPIRLRQVLWNLLNNAIKFTGRGSVTVAAHPTVGRRGLILTVADDGPGIDPELQGLVFEPFVQAERSDNYAAGSGSDSFHGGGGGEGGGGLGLGLSIVRGFVSAHGGSIALRSRVGRGSIFRVKLPAAWIDRDEMTPTSLHDDPLTDAVLTDHAGHLDGEQVLLDERRPMRILLAEDHPDTAKVTARLLKREGHDVTVAGGVAEALSAADHAGFDLVISDIGLGDGNGCDLMSKLRDRHGLLGIAVSGYATDADVRRSRAAGFFAHLVKPISLETLCEHIHSVADVLDDDADDLPALAALPADAAVDV